jgi:putative effector of murein hydrolase LrgA (UPF0299 family)
MKGRMTRWWQVLAGLAIIAGLALAGDLSARLLPIAVPGSIAGFAMFALLLWILPPLRRFTAPAADGLIAMIGAFIVPPAVGIALFLPELRDAAWPLAAVLIVSTVLTGLTAAFVYRALGR